ncbi:hypothetical protein HDK77DRAFT_485085 [Phyllosticta capitalensis]
MEIERGDAVVTPARRAPVTGERFSLDSPSPFLLPPRPNWASSSQLLTLVRVPATVAPTKSGILTGYDDEAMYPVKKTAARTPKTPRTPKYATDAATPTTANTETERG